VNIWRGCPHRRSAIVNGLMTAIRAVTIA
jgi:hypothetical protein